MLDSFLRASGGLTQTAERGALRALRAKDVLLKDVGGLRAKDGRWPFVVDTSGRTSTFIKYTGAAAAWC